MKTLLSRLRSPDPLKLDTTNGWLVAFTLNVFAFLIVMSAMVALSVQVKADEVDEAYEDVTIDIEDNSEAILDGEESAVDAVTALREDILTMTDEIRQESDADPQFCSRSARLGYLACAHDAADEFWTVQSDCTNVSDPIDHSNCRTSAYDEFDDATEECEEILEAREDFCGDFGEARLEVSINPDNFVNPADIGTTVDPNPYFPLVPGYRWTYEGDGETIQVEVTEDIFTIMDVPVVVVNDLVTEDGENVEDTNDYYAQDVDGNVWYFGEIALNYEDGRVVDVDGSWTAGEEKAQPGIIMHASPMVGMIYRQEYLFDEAEDVGEVIDTEATEMVPAAMCAGTCVVIRDYTPLEPDANELKYYAPGIGLILEVDLSEPETEDEEEEETEEEEESEDEGDETENVRVELVEFFQP